jgi:hypothetical protein
MGRLRRSDRHRGNDGCWREAVATVRSSGGPLTDLIPAAHPLGPEPLKMPLFRSLIGDKRRVAWASGKRAAGAPYIDGLMPSFSV